MSVSAPELVRAGVEEPVRRPERHLPGEAGLWVFILGDMVMFAVFFGVILVTRGQHPQVFRAGQQHLHVGLAVVNTILLLTGSWLVAKGMRSLVLGGGSSRLFLGALGCAFGFAAVKVVEYADLVGAGLTPATNDFFMYYFVFTGIHLAHLLIGAVLLTCMTVVARRPEQSAGSRTFAECGGVYWHMVDMLWLVLFPLLYLVR